MRWLSLLGLGGVAIFAAAVAVLHALRGDLDPLRHFVSEYAVGPHGAVMIGAFFALGGGSLALLGGLLRGGVSVQGRSKLGFVCLGIWGVGVCLAGVFPTDIPGAPPTTAGNIHQMVAVISFVSFLTSSITLSSRLARDPDWLPTKRVLLPLALLALAAFVLFFASMTTGLQGLAQRLFFVLIVLWLLAASFRLRTIAGQPHP